MFFSEPDTRHRDRVAVCRRVHDAASDSYVQRVRGLRESLGFIGARGQAFRQIPERDDDFVRPGAAQSCWIDKAHDVLR